MEHAPYDIDRMLRGLEVFLQLFTPAVIVLYLDIPPGIDIDFLYPCSKNVLGEEGKLCHFRVKVIDQLFLCFSLYRDAVVADILCDVPLDLLFYFLAPAFYHERGIFAGDILLHLF